jgi:hypothetical protein
MRHSTEGLRPVSPLPVKSVQSLSNRYFRVGLRVRLDGPSYGTAAGTPRFLEVVLSSSVDWGWGSAVVFPELFLR